MNKEFWGIYPALLTPFDDNEFIDEAKLTDYIHYLESYDLQGFYVGGSTGEALMMQDEERKHLFSLVKKITRTSNLKLIAHIGSLSTESAIDMGLHAKELGYDAISAVVPFYYALTESDVIKYYRDIVSATQMKMVIYNFFPGKNTSLSFDVLNTLFKDPLFVGIKHTCSNLFALNQFKALKPDIALFNGYDEIMLAGLSMGATGGIGSTYNIMPQKFIDLYQAFINSNLKLAKKIQNEICDIINILLTCGVIPAEKYILSKKGIDLGKCKKPLPELAEKEKNVLDNLSLKL